MAESTVKIEAPAKINLLLRVLGRRPDGYHELELVFQTIGWFDGLEVRNRDDGRVHLAASGTDLPSSEENLVVQAARLLQQTYGVTRGAELALTKNIPVAAGLGGGSSDAAAALRGLNRVWDLGLGTDELQRLARKLGADVPYCLVGGTCLGRGVGEKLTRLPELPPAWVVLAKPPVTLSTARVFRGYSSGEAACESPDLEAFLQALHRRDLHKIAASLGNDLEGVSRQLCPEIGKLRHFLSSQGSLGSLMSGSGPTVFALVEKKQEGLWLAETARQAFPEAWVAVAPTLAAMERGKG